MDFLVVWILSQNLKEGYENDGEEARDRLSREAACTLSSGPRGATHGCVPPLGLCVSACSSVNRNMIVALTC